MGIATRLSFISCEVHNRCFWVSVGVYSKNRNFRIYMSTKHGKNAPLVKSACNEFPVHTEQQFFLDSLVTCVRYDPECTQIIHVDAEGKSSHMDASKTKRYAPLAPISANRKQPHWSAT